MFSCRNSLTAVAAVTAALTFAVPAASANAATLDGPIVDPTVCSLLNSAEGSYGATAANGGAALTDVLNKVGASVGCSAAATGPAFPFPAFPFFPPTLRH
jgi:hypothetical protein